MENKLMESVFNVINTVAMTKEYTNWSDDHSRKEVKEALFILVKAVQKHIDFSRIEKEDLELLGFKSYKIKDNTHIMLIPLYCLPALPKGIEITSVTGKKKIVGVDDIDNDVRGGYIAYGISI